MRGLLFPSQQFKIFSTLSHTRPDLLLSLSTRYLHLFLFLFLSQISSRSPVVVAASSEQRDLGRGVRLGRRRGEARALRVGRWRRRIWGRPSRRIEVGALPADRRASQAAAASGELRRADPARLAMRPPGDATSGTRKRRRRRAGDDDADGRRRRRGLKHVAGVDLGGVVVPAASNGNGDDGSGGGGCDELGRRRR